MSSPPPGVATVASDGVDARASSPGGLRRILVHEEGSDIGMLPVVEPSSRSGRRVCPLAKEPPSRGVAEPSSRSERHLIKDSTRCRVVSDRRGLAPLQARQTAIRAPPAVLCMNPRGASPRPAAAEDMMSSRDELVGVYKGGRILYLAYSRTFKHADHPGVTLSTRVSTTPDGDHHGKIVRPARSRSLLSGRRAEGASRHGVHRRGLRHPSPSAGQPPNLYHLLEGAISDVVDSTIGMQIFVHKSSDDELKFAQEENMDMIDSFGKLKVSKVRREFLKMEKSFMHLIESSDKAIERKIVDSMYSFAQDNQAWLEYRALSDPSSESDNSEVDPSYDPESEGASDDQEPGDAGDENDDNGGSDDEEEEDEEDDDEEEDEEDEDDEEDDEEGDDEEGEDEEDDEEEEDEEDEEDDDVEDVNYDPAHDDDEDDDHEYMNGIANLPPLPPGTEYWNGVTVVHRVSAIRNLNPEFHVLSFGPDLTIHQRIRLWATGDARGFDFFPTEMLRYVWRMELLLNGQNPGNPLDAVNEPLVPNPGDYDDEGWSTDDDEPGDLDSGSSDIDED